MTDHTMEALNGAVAHLMAALPEADLVSLNEGYPEAVARHALKTRAETPWGHSIPEDVFRLYVLFPRVNNERLTFYHETIASALKPRLQGLSMRDAALEINHWCFEQATYRSTSVRTASPLTVMRAGFARCGEESTLAVSAMRAAGLPARQCYVPRWAHCDDNHAWIEVWLDGGWHYMGACEPEMVVDSGWFTAAASRAMLVHTRAWGEPPEGERVEAVNGREFTINRTGAYAPTALVQVRVTDHGVPRPGARVLFELCNMAEFFPICEKVTGPDGRTDLLTGLGSLRVRALDGEKAVWAVLDVREARECALDLKDAVELEAEPRSFRLVPPTESRIQPSPPPGPLLDAHLRRLEAATRLRETRLAGWKSGDPYADRAGGNREEILEFLADRRFPEADKKLLLDSLPEKDFYDVDRAVLFDALEGALLWKGAFSEEIWQMYLLCPRVANEERRPVRRALKDALKGLGSPEAVWDAVSKALKLRELVPAAVFPDSAAALRCGFTSATGLDVLFVDACRALGFPARLNPASGEKEFFFGGGFRPLIGDAPGPDATLTLRASAPLKYFEHFTLSRVLGGRDRTLDLEGMVLNGHATLPLRSGRYHVTAVTRQIDGTLDGITTPVDLALGGETELVLESPADDTPERLLRVPLPALAAHSPDGRPVSLPGHGDRALIAFLAPGEEPTEHFLVELAELKDEFSRHGVRTYLVVDEPEKAKHPRVLDAMSGFPGAETLVSKDTETILDWHRLLRSGDLRKPFAVAADEEGRGLFAFTNYFVGSVRALNRILDCANP
mgnify:CR=1 FL=1